MAQDVLNLNEASFEQIIKIIAQLNSELNNHIDSAVNQISALSNEWDDEEYQAFLESFNNIKNRLNDIDDSTNQIILEANNKLEMIKARRNIKM